MVCPCAGNEESQDFLNMVVFECVIRYPRIIIYLVIGKVVISSQFTVLSE